jgi:hypothetical protein
MGAGAAAAGTVVITTAGITEGRDMVLETEDMAGREVGRK